MRKHILVILAALSLTAVLLGGCSPSTDAGGGGERDDDLWTWARRPA